MFKSKLKLIYIATLVSRQSEIHYVITTDVVNQVGVDIIKSTPEEQRTNKIIKETISNIQYIVTAQLVGEKEAT